MNKKLYMIAALMFSTTVFAQSNPTWHVDGQNVGNTESQQVSGDFGAKMILTDNDEFNREWQQDKTPQINEVTTLKHGQKLAGIIIIAGCQEKNGTCNVTADFTVKTPGKKDFVMKNQPLWTGKSAGPDMLVAGSTRVMEQADPEDPNGDYEIIAVVKDNNAHESLTLTRHFQVTP
jgi:hypothetical protein